MIRRGLSRSTLIILAIALVIAIPVILILSNGQGVRTTTLDATLPPGQIQGLLPTVAAVIPTAIPIIPTAVPIIPTAVPIIPTAVPIIPTVAAIIPTAVPIVPTVAAVIPTAVPIIPTVAAIIPTAVPIVPTVAAVIPTVAQIVPTVAAVIPTVAQIVPTVAGVIPTVAQIVPTVAGVIPTVAGVIPTVAGVIPTVEGVIPTVAGVIPTVEGILPTVEGILPTVEGVIPTIEGVLSTEIPLVTTLASTLLPTGLPSVNVNLCLFVPIIDESLSVQFNNQSTYGNSFSWSFGDGTTSNETSPLHIYAAVGDYSITLTCDGDNGPVSITLPLGLNTISNLVPTEIPLIPTVAALIPSEVPILPTVISTLLPTTLATLQVNLCVFIPVIDTSLEVHFSNQSNYGDSFTWSFGDGATSNEANPTHGYGGAGDYFVTLTCSGENGSISTTIPFTLASVGNLVGTEIPLVPTLVGAVPTLVGEVPTLVGEVPTIVGAVPTVLGEVPTLVEALPTLVGTLVPTVDINICLFVPVISSSFEVEFSNQSTYGTSFSWDFGDGSTSSDASPSHIYSDLTSYNVTLTCDGANGPISTTLPINLGGLPVVPTLVGAVPTIVGAVPTVLGEVPTIVGVVPTIVAEVPTLVAEVPTLVGEVPTLVSTLIPPVNVDLCLFIPVVNTSLQVQFSNQSTYGDSYSWSFGDGSTSSEASPLHLYAGLGIYDVTLTCNGENGPISITLPLDLSNLATLVATEISIVPTLVGEVPTIVGVVPTIVAEVPTLVAEVPTLVGEVPTIVGEVPTLVSTLIPPVSIDLCLFIPVVNTSLQVQFSNQSTYGDSYSWSFGDGSTSSEASPLHLYAGLGIYDVTLTCNGENGPISITLPLDLSNLATLVATEISIVPTLVGEVPTVVGVVPTIVAEVPTLVSEVPTIVAEVPTIVGAVPTVLGEVPTIVAEVPTLVETLLPTVEVDLCLFNPVIVADLEVSLTNLSTYGTTFTWDFGDGTTSNEASPTHIYANAGTYTITLTCDGSNGPISASLGIGLVINLPNVVPTLTAPLLPVNVSIDLENPLNVHFDLPIVETDVTVWLWDFGDGTTSNLPDPTHIFIQPGTYTVSLSITTAGGQTRSLTIVITVGPLGNAPAVLPTVVPTLIAQVLTQTPSAILTPLGSLTPAAVLTQTLAVPALPTVTVPIPLTVTVPAVSLTPGAVATSIAATSVAVTSPVAPIVATAVPSGDLPPFPVIEITSNTIDTSSVQPEEWIPIDIGPAACTGVIAYQTNQTGNWEVFLVGSTQSNTNFTDDDKADDFSPNMSADGQWVAFTSNREGSWDIYVESIDESVVQRITNNVNAADTNPVWGPNDRVVYQSSRNGNWDIYMFDVTTGQETQLTNDAGNEINPIWSPDGTKVVYQGRSDALWQIYVVDVQTSASTLLSNGQTDDRNPIYMPDGSRIVYRSIGSSGTSVVTIMNTDGSGVASISNPAGNASGQRPSINGDQIAYQSDISGNYDIYIFNFTTGQTWQITNTPAADYSPVWDCNGTTLVFTSEFTGDADLYRITPASDNGQAMNIEQSAIPLTNDPGSDLNLPPNQ